MVVWLQPVIYVSNLLRRSIAEVRPGGEGQGSLTEEVQRAGGGVGGGAEQEAVVSPSDSMTFYATSHHAHCANFHGDHLLVGEIVTYGQTDV